MKSYAAEGKEEQGRAFSSKHITEITDAISKLEKAKVEVATSGPVTTK